MKRLCLLALACAPVWAAVTGTVVNRTTGAPEAGAAVSLYKLDQNGPALVAETKADAKGAFRFDKGVDGAGLVRSTVDGVQYTLTLQPGNPTEGVTLDVYRAAKPPAGIKVSKHMVMFEPADGSMTVNETLLFNNTGKTTWNDPAGGTLQFYMPSSAGGKADLTGLAPGGMGVTAPMVKTSKADVYGVDFPLKPGETRVDISYSVPYTAGAQYKGKIASSDENTYLVAPNGVTLESEGLNDIGLEPSTKAHIYGLDGASYSVTLTGAAAPAPETASESSDGAPQIEEVAPHLSGHSPWVLALALAVLALGFVMLYRAPGQSAKETNERGRG